MDTAAKKIVTLNIQELLKLLNKALADEWLAYYQYWVGSKIVRGIVRDIVQKELEEHAKEELAHANKLVDRIIQLEGTPILSPYEWKNQTNCGFLEPKDNGVVPILKQNIKGEACAINVYNKLLKFTEGKDPVTYDLILDILKEEIQHETDLQTILEDLKS
jgi:bacterioferritin